MERLDTKLITEMSKYCIESKFDSHITNDNLTNQCNCNKHITNLYYVICNHHESILIKGDFKELLLIPNGLYLIGSECIKKFFDRKCKNKNCKKLFRNKPKIKYCEPCEIIYQQTIKDNKIKEKELQKLKEKELKKKYCKICNQEHKNRSNNYCNDCRILKNNCLCCKEINFNEEKYCDDCLEDSSNCDKCNGIISPLNHGQELCNNCYIKESYSCKGCRIVFYNKDKLPLCDICKKDNICRFNLQYKGKQFYEIYENEKWAYKYYYDKYIELKNKIKNIKYYDTYDDYDYNMKYYIKLYLLYYKKRHNK